MNEWTYRAFKQVYHPNYKDYCAMAEYQDGNKVYMANAEGHTLKQALEKVKRRVEKLGVDPRTMW